MTTAASGVMAAANTAPIRFTDHTGSCSSRNGMASRGATSSGRAPARVLTTATRHHPPRVRSRARMRESRPSRRSMTHTCVSNWVSTMSLMAQGIPMMLAPRRAICSARRPTDRATAGSTSFVSGYSLRSRGFSPARSRSRMPIDTSMIAST